MSFIPLGAVYDEREGQRVAATAAKMSDTIDRYSFRKKRSV